MEFTEDANSNSIEEHDNSANICHGDLENEISEEYIRVQEEEKSAIGTDSDNQVINKDAIEKELCSEEAEENQISTKEERESQESETLTELVEGKKCQMLTDEGEIEEQEMLIEDGKIKGQEMLIDEQPDDVEECNVEYELDMLIDANTEEPILLLDNDIENDYMRSPSPDIDEEEEADANANITPQEIGDESPIPGKPETEDNSDIDEPLELKSPKLQEDLSKESSSTHPAIGPDEDVNEDSDDEANFEIINKEEATSEVNLDKPVSVDEECAPEKISKEANPEVVVEDKPSTPEPVPVEIMEECAPEVVIEDKPSTPEPVPVEIMEECAPDVVIEDKPSTPEPVPVEIMEECAPDVVIEDKPSTPEPVPVEIMEECAPEIVIEDKPSTPEPVPVEIMEECAPEVAVKNKPSTPEPVIAPAPKEQTPKRPEFNEDNNDDADKQWSLDIRGIADSYAGSGDDSLNTSGSIMDDVCVVCTKKVYQMEKLIADKVVYHKTCFKCEKCKRTLSTGNFARNNDTLYCKPHFIELFRIRGHYDERQYPVAGATKAPAAKANGTQNNREIEERPPVGDVIRASDNIDDGISQVPHLSGIRCRFEGEHDSTDSSQVRPSVQTEGAELPQRDYTKNILAKFREIEANGSSNERQTREYSRSPDIDLPPPYTAKSMAAVFQAMEQQGSAPSPDRQLRKPVARLPQSDAGATDESSENVPEVRSDVIRADNNVTESQEELPEEGTTRNLLERFKAMQTST